MTQQNAALDEEAAATAGSLQDQADNLLQVVGVLQLDDRRLLAAMHAAPGTPAAPAPKLRPALRPVKTAWIAVSAKTFGAPASKTATEDSEGG